MEPKFLVDFMLGRLCKWLRIFGFDTEYFTSLNKNIIVYQSLKEGRILLTRDQRVSKNKALKVLLIDSDNYEKQIQQVLKELNLKVDPEKMFTRCCLCNTLLEPIEKEKVKDKVPSFVYQTQENFSFCFTCQKIYWPGTHWDSMRNKYTQIQTAR
ncbi:MAG TPA: hypothetical protein DHV62_00080 [Elusimicrobia bacterium]|nr:hypothetical protein [Elusimicrobiota bacterium]